MNEKVMFNIEVTREQRQALKMAAAECEWPMSTLVRRGVAQVLRETAPARAQSWEPELSGTQHLEAEAA
jgi:hypothetical protein